MGAQARPALKLTLCQLCATKRLQLGLTQRRRAWQRFAAAEVVDGALPTVVVEFVLVDTDQAVPNR